MRHSTRIVFFLFLLTIASRSTFPANPFVDVSNELGFFERGPWGLYSEGLGGLAWLDYDGDDDLDLLVTNRLFWSNGLFRNDGDGRFVNVAASAGVANGWGNAGALAGDIDNDGCTDLFLTGAGGVIGFWGSPHKLYVNNCDGTFSDVSATDGITGPFPGLMAAFGDVNNDRYLDLFVTSPGNFITGQQTRNMLYINNGDRTFTDISAFAGIDTALGGCAVSFSDYDDDGLIDIYMGNCNDLQIDPTPFELYRNNGDFTFTDIAPDVGLADLGYWMAMAFGDPDLDGDLDLFSTSGGTSMPGNPYHGLFRRDGDLYTDVGLAAGVGAWEFGWGAAFIDYDNDGREDLVFTGSFTPMGFIGPGLGNPGRLFHNTGNGDFSMTASFGLASNYSSGLAVADFDENGFPDVAIATSGGLFIPGRPVLLRNVGNGNNWLTVRAVGTASNRDAVGARITVTAGDTSQIRQVTAGSSFMSTSSPWPTFGLGTHAQAHLQVRWPSGLVETFPAVEANRRVTVVEGTGTPVEP